jgi:hypothetical protein
MLVVNIYICRKRRFSDSSSLACPHKAVADRPDFSERPFLLNKKKKRTMLEVNTFYNTVHSQGNDERGILFCAFPQERTSVTQMQEPIHRGHFEISKRPAGFSFYPTSFYFRPTGFTVA